MRINSLRANHIFVQLSEAATDTPDYTPDSHIYSYLGELGMVYRIDPTHPNGGEPVSHSEYLEG